MNIGGSELDWYHLSPSPNLPPPPPTTTLINSHWYDTYWVTHAHRTV